MSTCCGRWLGETSDPGAATQGRRAPAGRLRGVPAAGLSYGPPAPLIATTGAKAGS